MEYKLLNQRVNTLAIELTALDFEQNKTEVNRIRIEMFEKLQQMLIHGGTVEKYRYLDDLYECPLIKRDMGDCLGQKEKVGEPLEMEKACATYVAYDVFIDAFRKTTAYRKERKGWAYNIDRGSFITYFSKVLANGMRDYWKTFNQKLASNYFAVRLDEPVGEDETTWHERIADQDQSVEEQVLGNPKAIRILEEFDKALEKWPGKKQCWYRAFYTFDMTKIVKSDMILARVAVQRNDDYFPHMQISLLQFLMYGTFAAMLDVVQNKLKEHVNLDQRGKLLAQFLNVTEKTISQAYLPEYRRLVEKLM